MSRSTYVLRWVAVLPGAVFSALLVEFPIHWAVELIQYSGTVDDHSVTIYSTLFAAITPDVLEYFGYAFFVPFIITSIGARIAPKYKFPTAIALAIGMGFSYGWIATQIAGDISSGSYTSGSWLRLAITIVLAIAGLSAGLFQAYKHDKAIQDVTVA